MSSRVLKILEDRTIRSETVISYYLIALKKLCTVTAFINATIYIDNVIYIYMGIKILNM